MSEPPDFDQIAVRLIVVIDRVIREAAREPSEVREAIAEQLRQVWNARGATDRATVDAALAWTRGTFAESTRTQLDQALRSLDR